MQATRHLAQRHRHFVRAWLGALTSLALALCFIPIGIRMPPMDMQIAAGVLFAGAGVALAILCIAMWQLQAALGCGLTSRMVALMLAPLLLVMLLFPLGLCIAAQWELQNRGLRIGFLGITDEAVIAQLLEEQCPSCGYSLIGNVSGICPECGRPTPDAKAGQAAKSS